MPFMSTFSRLAESLATGRGGLLTNDLLLFKSDYHGRALEATIPSSLSVMRSYEGLAAALPTASLVNIFNWPGQVQK